MVKPTMSDDLAMIGIPHGDGQLRAVHEAELVALLCYRLKMQALRKAGPLFDAVKSQEWQALPPVVVDGVDTSAAGPVAEARLFVSVLLDLAENYDVYKTAGVFPARMEGGRLFGLETIAGMVGLVVNSTGCENGTHYFVGEML